MSGYTDALASMRAQAKAEIDAAGAACTIGRYTSSKDASGKVTTTYGNLSGSTIIWIQPLAGTNDVQTQGLNIETTHLGFQAYDGRALQVKDRILAPGGTYSYDVINALLFDSHRMAELKLVPRA